MGRPPKDTTPEELAYRKWLNNSRHQTGDGNETCPRLELEEWLALRDLAEGRCMICGQPPNGRGLNYDHGHGTDKVRGVICTSCNIGLGYFKDKPEVLDRAAEYLRLTRDGYGGLTRLYLDTRPLSVKN